MRILDPSGAATTALLLFWLTASACQKDEPAATETAAATATPGASGVDPKNPCTIPSASPAHVAQALGTGRLEGPTDVPGFGDKAFSQTSSTDLGSMKLVINTLVVLKGKVMVIISSPASFEKIRALESDVLRDLGA